LRLSYSTATPPQIESGVAILVSLVRERWPDRAGASEPKPVETMPVL
jgi:hypothetical protein